MTAVAVASIPCPHCRRPAWDHALHGFSCPIFLNICPGCDEPLFAGRCENVYVAPEGRDWHIACFEARPPVGDDPPGGRSDFTRWLRQQRDRNDHVGHLADDCHHDRDWPHRATLAGFEDYLVECGAIPEAIDALHRAWAEWWSQPPPPRAQPSAPPPRYPPPRRPRHLTGDAAWEAFVALGGDGLAANHAGWHRRPCPAHSSKSGNSCVFKLDDTTGIPTLIIHDHACCTEREVLEAIDVDTSRLEGIDGLSTREWLTRDAVRPRTFPPFVDPARPTALGPAALIYFARKRGFDLDVLQRAGVTAVQHPYRWRRDRKLNVRARFPFTVDGHLVGAWDRAILDVAPGGRRWMMTGTIPVPFGWDTLPTARDTGHVYIVEGPTDAIALMHALPGAAVLGVGVGRSMWHPWWGPEFRLLTVWLVADNDTGGAMTRRVAHEVLDPYAWEILEPRIPRWHNDVDQWRTAAGDAFRHEFLDAMQHAVIDRRKAA